jgi:hypothetical protein
MGLADSFAGVRCDCEEQSGKKAAWRESCRIIRHLGSEISRNGNKHALSVFELGHLLVRFDHIASLIVNADHSIV